MIKNVLCSPLQALSVHCAWGRGRTGTMIACYLAQVGNLTAEEAIKKIREIRPGSIDTERQAGAVEAWVKSLQENGEEK